MSIVRGQWRTVVHDVALAELLALAGCPVSLPEILATLNTRNAELYEWVQAGLRSGVMLRTSQAEHIARGESLDQTAKVTGVGVEYVLYTLTRLEEDEAEIDAFYSQNGST